LSGANLSDAVFEAASLKGANLTGATGLTQKQLDETCDDGSADPAVAIMPAGLVLERCE
jgi:uncharacterized protein YjbI with pentapeptide repeats